MKLEIFILDKNNKKVSIKAGDMIVGYTGLKEDVYKATDPQVISGKRKIGESKIRYGLILNIKNQYDIDIIFASNTLGEKFPAENQKGNRNYLFCAQTIRFVNPQKDKVILKKCSNNYQLKEPELVLNKIILSSSYVKFIKKKEKRKFVKSKIKRDELEM